MTGKTKKDLEAENALLKEELSDVKNKLSKLSEKYENLQTNRKPEKNADQNQCLRCEKCNRTFEKLTDMKKHKNEHKAKNDTFDCDQCEKKFNEEWKLCAHVKTHVNYKCDQCSKTFRYLDVMDKHTQISHGNLKLYCHFYNNMKTCPFDEECVFLHEDAELCRYGVLCERIYCMFRHDDVGKSMVAKDSVWNVEETIENDDEKEEAEVDNLEMTFQNPSQENNIESEISVKCDLCNFETTNKERMKRHSFENHSVKGKNICIQCKHEFDTRKHFNSHNYHGCG